jgi:hypothetical protein
MKSSNPNSGCNEVDVASTLDTWRPDPSLNQGGIAIVEPSTVGALAARDYKGVGNQYVAENKCVVETLLLDGTRVDDVRVYESPVQTLKERMGTGGNNVPMVAFSHTQGLDAQPSESAWPTLRKEGNGHAVAIPIQDGREIEKNQNGLGVADEGAPAYTIDQTGAQAVAYPIHPQAVSSGGNSRPNSDGRGNGLGIGKEGDPSTAVVGTTPPAVAAGTATMVVRRLTPLECERLNGLA